MGVPVEQLWLAAVWQNRRGSGSRRPRSGDAFSRLSAAITPQVTSRPVAIVPARILGAADVCRRARACR